jgi:hypothetical protein
LPNFAEAVGRAEDSADRFSPIVFSARRGILPNMISAQIQNRHKQLVAEQSVILDQLDDLEELRVVPGPLGPTEAEQRLLDRWTEIENAYRVLWYLQQGRDLPPGWEW